ncbi:MAG: hypothetical protein L0271_23790 [Gemmatimonadetes bacterium]|nr:hypothetical protein [Gemmatimonadota bacterium]
MSEHGFLDELKRRKVVRAGILYAAGVFAVLQVADIVAGPLGLPAWTMPTLVWAGILGFPVVAVIAWARDWPGRAESAIPATRWLPARTLLAAVSLVAVGLIGGWLLRNIARGRAEDSAPASSDGDVIAVAPFTVMGGTELAYLSDGMASLLSPSLDGTAGLRTINAHALLAYRANAAPASIGPAEGEQLAAHFGAGLYVVGSIVASGDSLRIEATLFDRTRTAAAPVSASTVGTADDLFDAVDRLATRLVAERTAVTGSQQTTRVAALATSSAPALRAWLEGERRFRAGSYLPAIEAFRTAIAADTTFALAYYRLSMTEERLAWAEASRISAEAAYRHSARLSPRNRQFLEAVVALRRGSTTLAEQMLRAHVRQYPDDAEAWYQLGEVLFHGEPLRGGSMTAAKAPLESALRNDPGDLGALYHRVRIAVREDDAVQLDSLTSRFYALSPGGERTLELRALQAAGTRDAAAAALVLEEMRRSPDTFLPIALWSVATFGGDPRGAEAIGRLMTGDDRPATVRGAGHVQLAYLALTRGRYGDAIAQLDAAERFGDPDVEAVRAWFAALPFLPAAEASPAAARQRLLAWSGAASAGSPLPSSFFSAHNGVQPILRTYLLGLLSLRSGDQPSARSAGAALEATRGLANAESLARQLATGGSALSSEAAGDDAAALAQLTALRIEGWYELTFVSPFFAGALERFTLTELLYRAGRAEEALGWYEGLAENTVGELVFLGPGLLRIESIHRAAGRIAEADGARRRFETLWQDADPALRQHVLTVWSR